MPTYSLSGSRKMKARRIPRREGIETVHKPVKEYRLTPRPSCATGPMTDMISNMKTIAVTVDEATLKFLDELTDASPRLRSRSALVRAALREFAERERRRVIEARDGEVFRKHRKRLVRQARMLISEQARP